MPWVYTKVDYTERYKFSAGRARMHFIKYNFEKTKQNKFDKHIFNAVAGNEATIIAIQKSPDDTLGDLTEPVGSSVMTPLKIMAVSILDAR